MSNQPDQEKQPSEILSSEEARQSILAELETSKQELTELDDEQLMEVTGGGFMGTVGNVMMNMCCDPISALGAAAGGIVGGVVGGVKHRNIGNSISTGSMIGSFADPVGGLVKGAGKAAFKTAGKGVLKHV